MHLKIFCEKLDVLTKDILQKLHECGYKMEIVFVGGYKPVDKDGFFSFYSRRLLGSFVQLSLCDPKKIRKSFSASSNIIFLSPEYIFRESDIDILSEMDDVLVANPIVSNRLERHGLKKKSNIIDVQCYYDILHIDKSKSENFIFLFHSNWKEEMGWKELLFSYCNAFPHSEANLIISTDFNVEIVNNDIDKFLALNNFNRSNYPGICVLSGKIFSDVLKFADCFVAPYLVEYYDQNVLTAMRCGIPLIINRLSPYQHFCRKNTCWVVDFINDDTIDILQTIKFMKEVLSDKDIVIEKTEIAKQFLQNAFGKHNFFGSIIDTLNKNGVDKISDLKININEKGNII